MELVFQGGVGRRGGGGGGGKDAQQLNQHQMSSVHHHVAHPATSTSMEADDLLQESTHVVEVVLPQHKVDGEEG